MQELVGISASTTTTSSFLSLTLLLSSEFVAAGLGEKVFLSLPDLILMFLVQHFCSHNKSLAHIHVGLGRCLNKELNIVVSAEFLTCLLGYFSLRFSIRLISYEDNDGVRLRLGTHLIAPMGKVLEALHRSNTIGQQNGMCTSVKYLGNALE